MLLEKKRFGKKGIWAKIPTMSTVKLPAVKMLNSQNADICRNTNMFRIPTGTRLHN